jgi:methionyl aminopeptidase
MKRRSATASLKRPDEIEAMRRAGRVVFQVLQRVREMVRPGVSTAQLNSEAERLIASAGAQPLFRGVKSRQAAFPFPAALCTSVNEQVVHGLPSTEPLVEGSVVSVDCGVRLGGFCGDSATTIPVGEVAPEVGRLLKVTAEALEIAIREIRPKRWWSEVAGRMQAHVEAAGFSVVREFVGHGIGREMHEEPKVPNYADPLERRLDFMLLSGMVIAVEPMVNIGTAAVVYADDSGWPVVTKDGTCSAHFEHTIAVTDRGADVLTDGR